MPRGDGTGPMGMGPITGRGAGFCAGYAVPGCMNAMPGRGGMGFGRRHGRGSGMGLGWRYGRNQTYQGAPPVVQPAPYSPVDELSMLREQAKNLGETLQSINGRISELEADKK